jgi:hypothetical protein
MNLSIAPQEENMDCYWTFRTLSAAKYELVLVEDGCLYRDRVVWAPGYQSSRLLDILQAIWYLKSGFPGRLPEHTVRILDSFRKEAADMVISGP